MLACKRKRPSYDDDLDKRRDENIDISSALMGKKTKTGHAHSDEDEDLLRFIKASITKRDVKEGTQVVKMAKGKSKVGKGEVGGGSFQSMGYSSFSAPEKLS